ncbi:N-6 DNA methylase [uncultured Bifidobacterium sp.]|uniref:N-6 DNA methylase n=1 Tax=uncultured Bifidobacterium sp. TaxID=165187 RepID=UPI00338E7DA8
MQELTEKKDKDAGRFYTPTCVVRILVEIIQPSIGVSTQANENDLCFSAMKIVRKKYAAGG